MKKKILITIITLILFSQIANSGKLADFWSDVIKKYPPPIPTKEERNRLSNIYSSNFSNYPEYLFNKNIFAIEEIEQKASYYLRRHEFDSSYASLCRNKLKPYKQIIEKASCQRQL